jgi:2'-5' RNA ligase
VTDRLFLAIWPPTSIIGTIEEAIAPLRDRYEHIRWQPGNRWHITLAFLGERETAVEVRRLRATPQKSAQSIRLHGAGRFGPILWMGVDAGPWLARLASEIQTAHHCPDRRFSAHMTLGRSRSALGSREVSQASAALAAFSSPTWTPREMTLVRSVIGPKPVYEVVLRTPLTVDGT